MSEQASQPQQEGHIQCSRCGNSNSPLEEPPFDSDLGKQIQGSICRNCWREWIQVSVRVINEYRLNLAMEEHSEILTSQMKQFLGIQG